MKEATNFRTRVMKNAWHIFKNSALNWVQSLKKAWELYRLRTGMLQGQVVFLYRKVDGSIREAYGTLREIAFQGRNKSKRSNPAIMCYFDNRRGAYRSFRIENFICIESAG